MANPYAWLSKELRKAQNPDSKVGKNGTPLPIDFTNVVDSPDEPFGYCPIKPLARVDNDGNLLNKAAMGRRVRKKRRKGDNSITPVEAEVLYGKKKPLELWDTEELARGRPRNKNGNFSGPKPKYVTMDMHEEAIDRFARVIKTDMSVATITAMEKVNDLLNNEETDYRGKPLVSAATKLDAAKFLLEHIVGKPKQHIEQDVSIKLQGILGSVIVNPGENENYQSAHMPGVTMELATREDYIDAEIEEDSD